MRVLLFIHSLRNGGAERVCSYVANSLSCSMSEVLLVTIDEQFPDDYVLNVDVHRISLKLARSSRGPLNATFNNLVVAKCLREVLRAYDVDIVVSFMTRANIVCALSCLGGMCHHVACERNNPAMNEDNRLWRGLRRVTYSFSDVVVAQTGKGCAWLRENTSAKQVEIIPNPVVFPLSINPLVDETQLVPDNDFILAVGRLNSQKQFDHLITAFGALPVEYDHWRLVILGEGPDRKKLERLVSIEGLEHRVTIQGRVQNISLWYENAKIFVLSSRYEGFPNALVEAMSYGVSVVSYDCDTGPSELIESGVNGFLVKADDVVGLSKKIMELVGSETLRKKTGQSARLVKEQYSLEKVMNKWTLLLQSVLK